MLDLPPIQLYSEILQRGKEYLVRGVSALLLYGDTKIKLFVLSPSNSCKGDH